MNAALLAAERRGEVEQLALLRVAADLAVAGAEHVRGVARRELRVDVREHLRVRHEVRLDGDALVRRLEGSISFWYAVFSVSEAHVVKVSVRVPAFDEPPDGCPVKPAQDGEEGGERGCACGREQAAAGDGHGASDRCGFIKGGARWKTGACSAFSDASGAMRARWERVVTRVRSPTRAFRLAPPREGAAGRLIADVPAACRKRRECRRGECAREGPADGRGPGPPETAADRRSGEQPGGGLPARHRRRARAETAELRERYSSRREPRRPAAGGVRRGARGRGPRPSASAPSTCR